MLKLYLLGPPRLELDSEALALESRKNTALVAYLAVTSMGGFITHTREALVTLLWPELEPSRARAGLRRNLSVLRKALDGQWLIVDRTTVCTDPEADLWLDVVEFRRLLGAWGEHGHAESEVCDACLDDLAAAVDLYRGDFMDGLSLRDSAAFDDWQFFQAEDLRQELAWALERLVRAHSDRQQYEPAIRHARRWLALDQLHEPVHQRLIELFARSGQRSAALRQYETCQRILDEELGLPPSPETSALYERVRSGTGFEPQLDAPDEDAPSSDGAAPLPCAASAPGLLPHNLPVPSTPFVGRDQDLAEVRAKLEDADCRLLTLLGPGGMGKTRLALKAAQDLVDDQVDLFEHGIYFVPLAPLAAAEAITPAVAESLCFRFYDEGTPEQQLLDYVRQKRMLFVMDNYEHLLTATETDSGDGVGLLTEILAAAPGIKVLVTSRSRLQVQGEHLYPLGGMKIPVMPAEGKAPLEQNSAVKLFVQGARRVRPDLILGEQDLEAVAQICSLVQGMPLGILLAAAWVELLSPAEIAAEMEGDLDFLETDLRDIPARQRSIRAVFDHSWRLLSDRERAAFQGLSLFHGGFTLEAADAVTWATLRDLMSLVNKSLLHRVPEPATLPGAGARFEVHELLRQYAADKLIQSGSDEEVRNRHAVYYVAALERWSQELKSERQLRAMAEMDLEIENAREAWDWAVSRRLLPQIDHGLDALRLYYVWRMRYLEGLAQFREAVRQLEGIEGPEAQRVLVRVRIALGVVLLEAGDRHAGVEILSQCLQTLDGLPGASLEVRADRALIMLNMGHIRYYPDPLDSWECYQKGLELYQELGDQWGTARALDYLGWVAEVLGDYRKATDLLKRSLAIREELGDWRGIANVLTKLGIVCWVQGQFQEGEDLLRKALSRFQDTNDGGKVAYGTKHVGEVLVRQGRFAEGLELINESLDLYTELGHGWGVNWVYPFRGEAHVHLGEYQQAREIIGLAVGHAQRASYRWAFGFSDLVLGLVALVENEPGKAMAHLKSSLEMFADLQHRENQGWTLGVMGLAARGLGQGDEAWTYVRGAVETWQELGAIVPLLYALPATALLFADTGQTELAVEVHALAITYGFCANSTWYQDVAGRQLEDLSATLPPETALAANERGRSHDLDTLADLLLAASTSF